MLRNLLSPWERTSQGDYWLLLTCLAACAFCLMKLTDHLASWISIAILVALQAMLGLATLRRIHDAGWSRWWILLFLFPATMTLGVGFGHVLDITAILRSIPVLIGLFAATRPHGGELRVGAGRLA
jgi:uncharacterized membrane protein YhaH (DUF805 family)